MKFEVKSIFSCSEFKDIDEIKFNADEEFEFSLLISVGFEGEKASTDFSTLVISPIAEKKRSYPGQHIVRVNQFEPDTFKEICQYIVKQCADKVKHSKAKKQALYDEFAHHMLDYFDWEYEGFQGYE